MFWALLKKIPTPLYFLILGIGSLLISFFGMFLQYYLQLHPCPYCIFQRVLYFFIAFAAFILLAVCRFPKAWKALALFTVLVALFGSGLASYQSVMQFFPGVLPECGFSDPNFIERFVDVLGNAYPEWFLATGFCSSKEWVFLGLSIANWSVLCFLGIAAYLVALVLKR